jgi:ribosomal protein L11 methyltransferase
VWTEVQIEVAPEAAELLASEVGELTGGVEVRDAGTIIRADAGRALVIAQCAPEDVDSVLAAVHETCDRARQAGLPVDPVLVRTRLAHEDEWRDVWKQYFRAVRVGRTFLVRPTWDRVAAGPADRVIDIDPGRAFGTGGHASTRLCMVLAEEITAQPVTRFLDLGCGSGILSIAAARLWPGASGLAVDLDPEAAACAAENLSLNQVDAARVETRPGTLADAVHAGARFDLVLANIQADVLLGLAPALTAHLSPGGHLILAGLLQSDAAAVAEAYRGAGLVLEARRDEDEWAALRFSAGA